MNIIVRVSMFLKIPEEFKIYHQFNDDKFNLLKTDDNIGKTTKSLLNDVFNAKKLHCKDVNFSISKNFTTQDYAYLPSSKENVNGKSIDKELPMPSRGIAQFRVILKVHPEVLTNLRFLDNRSVLWCPTGKFVAVWICVVCME